MIDFNQYVAKRLLTACVGLALDDIEADRTIHHSEMRYWLGSKYAEYDASITDVDFSPGLSKAAIEWNDRRVDLMRRITLMVNRRLVGERAPRSAEKSERERLFLAEAELLLESYRDRIEGTNDEAGFINYEDWTQAPWDEPFASAHPVIGEFWPPRLRKADNEVQRQYRREMQRRYLQDLFDELEGQVSQPEPEEDVSGGKIKALFLTRRGRNY